MGQPAVIPAYTRADGYAALGLARNPFAAEQEPGVAPHLWVARPDEPPMPAPARRQLVQLIGSKGAGKTSLLLRWRARQPGPYHYVLPGLPRWRVPPVASLVYWDEIDRMAAPVRLGAFLVAAATGATVVAGTHVDLASLARRCGLNVVTHVFAPLSPALLHAWATQRIDEARLDGVPPGLILDNATAEQIVAEVGPSWREAAVLLHIWAAQHAARACAAC